MRVPFDCVNGYYSTGAATSCTVCPLGKSCTISSAPSACSNNNYSIIGYYECNTCPYGGDCSSTSTSELFTTCSSGQYWSGNACVDCEKGYECPTGLDRNTLP